MENEKNISSEEAEKNIDPINDMDTLNALLLERESGDEADYQEAQIEFDSFISEYRSLITKTLADAATEREHREATAASGNTDQPASLPKKQKTNKTNTTQVQKDSSDWNDEITLTPTEYTDLVDETEEPEAEPITQEKPKEDDNDLGSVADIGDEFQIAIDFDGNSSREEDETEDTSSKYDPDKPRFIDWVFDIAEIFVFVLAAVMIVSMFIFRPSMVEGGSMLNTLEDGDQLIISNLFYTPERNDIIVFEDYTTGLKKAVVKRVIGLPNETVEIRVTDDGHRLIILINGEEIEDEYGYYASFGGLDGCAPITLGENEIFVMGDNRKNSTDSRYFTVGAVSTDAILGKVIFRFFPFEKIGTID